MTSSIREDLVLGAAHGLAASALVWTWVLAPPAASADTWAVMLAAWAAGALHLRTRPIGRVSLAYAAGLSGLLVGGPTLSVVAALVCRIGASSVGRRRTRRVLYHLFPDLSRVTLAMGAAALAAAALGHAPPWAALPAHALVYFLVERGMRWLRHGRGLQLDARRELVAWAGYAVACGAAVGTAFLLRLDEGRTGLVAIAALALTGALHRARRERQRLVSGHRVSSLALCHSVTEALARTMGARDEDTRAHLRRVQELSVHVGERMGLSAIELEALSAAALLHDLGKVAVPDGILTKPGRLTAEEMERVKLHPALGAEILQGIPFPYPLAPIVRHHHERWDGRGYPAGLRGEAIPLGARILSAVDSYDALTSERPYRRALSHDAALEFIRRESGKMFDPAVLDGLLDHFEDGIPRAPTGCDRPAGAAGAAGTTEDAHARPPATCSLPRARAELELLYELERARGYGMRLDEYLTLAACRLSEIIPHRAFVLYGLVPEERTLVARFAFGQGAAHLRSIKIRVGERLSGWAALQGRAFIGSAHRNPVDRDGTRSDLEEWADDPELGDLRSTLVAPLVADDRVVGVVTLYADGDRAFSGADRRLLVRAAGCMAESYLRVEPEPDRFTSGLTDPLTGVPNARFLWLEAAHRFAAGDAFGLLAFRVVGLEPVSERLGNVATDRLLSQTARRFASGCADSETLVRFGEDLFIVLTPASESGALVGRWNDLAGHVEDPPMATPDGAAHRIRLVAAHASFPHDAGALEELMACLDRRLAAAAEHGRTIVPFPTRRLASTTG